MIPKIGTVVFCSVLLAGMSACRTGHAVSVPGLNLSERNSFCWGVSSGYPHWQPVEVVLTGEPPYTDADIESFLALLSMGRLSTSQVKKAIDQETVVRLEYLVMGSGDFFSYALSDGYKLTYRNWIRGGDTYSGYCIRPKHAGDGFN